MLTSAECRNAKPREKAYKLSDARGLYLYVSTTGHRSWRWKFRIDGKEKRLVLGTFPEMSLADARAAREDAAREKRGGKDPSRKTGIQSDTFKEFALAWHEMQKPRWSAGHAATVLERLEAEAFPLLGRRPISSIDVALVLDVLNPIVKRGATDQAQRMRQRLSEIFVLAIASGHALLNPAEMVRKALPTVIKRNYAAVTSIEDARALLIADVRLPGGVLPKLASRLLALTAVRMGSIRFAEPGEFEGLDGDEPIWRIPAAKLKLSLEQRKQTAMEFIVPLSRQAVEIVKMAQALTAPGPYVFPNQHDRDKPMDENSMAVRYRKIPGFGGRHVPHGWRSTFSTIMNERAVREGQAGDRAIIDLMLAHQPTGVEPIYNRAAYMPRRRELAQEWADLLHVGLPTLQDILASPFRS